MYDNYRKKRTLEEAIKRIQQINEYVFEADPTGNLLTDDDNNQQDQQQQPMPNDQVPDGDSNAPQGQDMNMPADGDPDEQTPDMGQQPPMDNQPHMDDQQGGPAMGEEPMEQMPNGGMPMDGEAADTMHPGDEVIDVDELTDKQDETSAKLDDVDAKIAELSGVLDKFMTAIQNNDSKIDDLKREMEKRNPTAEERMNIRKNVGSPFAQTPAEAFKQYDSRMDNDNLAAPDKETVYEITYDDIAGGDDASVAKTFSSYPNTLEDYFA